MPIATWTTTFQDASWLYGLSALVTAIGGIIYGNRRHGRRIADVADQVTPTPKDVPSAEDHATLRELVTAIGTSLDNFKDNTHRSLELFREENRLDHAAVRQTISENHLAVQGSISDVQRDVTDLRERVAKAEITIVHNHDELEHLEQELHRSA